jgi:hypothetical protein
VDEEVHELVRMGSIQRYVRPFNSPVVAVEHIAKTFLMILTISLDVSFPSFSDSETFGDTATDYLFLSSGFSKGMSLPCSYK